MDIFYILLFMINPSHQESAIRDCLERREFDAEMSSSIVYTSVMCNMHHKRSGIDSFKARCSGDSELTKSRGGLGQV